MNALIIESSRMFQKLLCRIFERNGIDAVAVDSCSRANQSISEQCPTIICLSYELRDGKSADFCQQIRNNPDTANIPVLLLSASKLPQETLYSSGITETFNKKNINELEQYIESFAQKHQQTEKKVGKILYAEDSMSIAKLTIKLLTDVGYTVDHFTTAEEAIEAFSKNTYDLLLTDIVLAGSQSGTAIVRTACNHPDENRRQIPILAMSSFNDNARKIELFNQGVNDYIVKPVLKEELLARVGNMVSVTQTLRALKKKQQEFANLAMKDQLTQLYNRHYVIDTVPGIISHAKRHNFPVSIIVLDIDHFKSINDNHGHTAGDNVLQHVGQLLKDNCRNEDVAARFGGEEFIVLLQQCNILDALEKAEILRQKLETLKPACLDVTGSFGVSTLEATDNNFTMLFDRADKALYQAKTTGRNCVVP